MEKIANSFQAVFEDVKISKIQRSSSVLQKTQLKVTIVSQPSSNAAVRVLAVIQNAEQFDNILF